MLPDWRARWPDRAPVPATAATAALAVLAGAIVFVLGHELFPYYSVNNDEAVYLKQAALLLDGRLHGTTEFPGAFRQWFFLADGEHFYPRYTPVTAAVIAPALALGVPRLALAAVAAANVALVAAVTREVFDARAGVVASVLLLASPMFLLTSSVFLSYAPTFCFEVGFVLAYLRAYRRASRGYAALAGLLIGIAFFSRQYTAVLFAAPFVLHALVRLGLARRTGDRTRVLAAISRAGPIAAGGLAFVAVTLAYNRAVTGSPLVFPFQAYAPMDTLGFGTRSFFPSGADAVRYTPWEGITTSAHLLRALLTRWGAFGPVGAAFAALGIVYAVGEARSRESRFSRSGSWVTTGDSGGFDWREQRGDGPRGDDDRHAGLPDTTARLLLVGTVVSVVLGNVFFWGNDNILGMPPLSPGAFVTLFGPYYHFDLLLALSAFGAAGALGLGGRVRDRVLAARGRLSTRQARAIVAVAVLVVAPVAVAAEYAALGPPIERNAAYTDHYSEAYAPFETAPDGAGIVPASANATIDGAGSATDTTRSPPDTGDRAAGPLVFLPTPYGSWLAHPFQYLRNDPSLAERTVYALDRNTTTTLALLDARANRTPYRYVYRGEWSALSNRTIEPRLQALVVRTAPAFRATTAVGVVENATRATIRLTSPDGSAVAYRVADPAAAERVEWELTPEGARVLDTDAYRRTAGDPTVPFDDAGRVALSITFRGPDGPLVTYRQNLSVATNESTVRTIWPPRTTVCRLATGCGEGGTFVPAGADGQLAVTERERVAGLSGATSGLFADQLSLDATLRPSNRTDAAETQPQPASQSSSTGRSATSPSSRTARPASEER